MSTRCHGSIPWNHPVQYAHAIHNTPGNRTSSERGGVPAGVGMVFAGSCLTLWVYAQCGGEMGSEDADATPPCADHPDPLLAAPQPSRTTLCGSHRAHSHAPSKAEPMRRDSALEIGTGGSLGLPLLSEAGTAQSRDIQVFPLEEVASVSGAP